jgi:hypothetical protein
MLQPVACPATRGRLAKKVEGQSGLISPRRWNSRERWTFAARPCCTASALVHKPEQQHTTRELGVLHMAGYTASERLSNMGTPTSGEYLLSVRPSTARCADFTAAEGPLERIGNGWVHDATLGWTLVNAHRSGSVDGSLGVYTYDEALAGGADRPRAVIA